MSLNKKLLAGAIAGLLFSANANAVVLDGVAPYVYATELVNGTDLLARVAEAPLNYNFSANEVRYGRFSCEGATLSNLTVATTSALIDLGAVNGNGTNTIFFSMTGDPTITAATPTAADMMNVTADVELLNKNDVTCEFALYDLPSQAQAGGADGLVIDSGTDGYKVFIERESGFVFESDPARPQQATADVEAANGAYTDYVAGDFRLGNFQFQAVTGVLNAAGAQIVLTDIFSPDTTVTIEGDYSVAVQLWAFNFVDFFWYVPDDFDTDAGVATFDMANFNGGFDANLELEPTFTDPMPESEYTASLHADANTGYEVDDILDMHVGAIVRNGTQLQAPLAQIPANWLSRVALTNTGNVARPYEMSIMTETGTTGVLSSNSGSIPAGGTVVIDLPGVLTLTGQPRATINVNVSAPNDQIQGLYQIVNPEKGSISNHVMVRPGTN